MGIIGTQMDPRRGEPRELFDAIREEVFTDLPVPEAEVDVFVVFKAVDTVIAPDGEEVPIYEVIDYEVTRIDDEYLLDVVPHVGNIEYLMAVDDWARNVEDMTQYMWVHRHPDGMIHASSKDRQFMSNLITIDFARGDHEKRQFMGGAIIDSFNGIPLPAGDYWPPRAVENAEIDIAVSEYHLQQALEQGFAEDSPTVRIARWSIENLAEFYEERRTNPEGERATQLESEVKAIHDELAAEIDAADPFARLKMDMPPELREIFERIDAMAEEMGLTIPEAQLRPAEASAAEPFEPPAPKEKSIFDLPKLGEEDDPKINWN